MLRHHSSEVSPLQTPQPAATRPTTLSELLYQDTVDKALANEPAAECGGLFSLFSQVSKADTFDVSAPQGGGVLTQGLDDDQIQKWLRPEEGSSSAPRLRLFFLDAVPDQPDVLPVTEPTLRDVLDVFGANARFTDNIARQHMPGREIHQLGDGSVRHELWYTAVLRSAGDRVQSESGNRTLEFTRQFAYWQRFVMWSDYQLHKDANGADIATATYMIWRCPLRVNQTFVSTFSGANGLRLLDHPMAVHAFMVEKIVLYTHDYLARLSGPLYEWENKASELRTPDDYTARSRAFLTLSRQIHQISTDHDILSSSIDHLKVETAWFGRMFAARPNLEYHIQNAQSAVEDIFANLEKEVSLIKVYTRLYLERSKIGVDECYAMVNQRDSELNIQIAQASNQDNRSLRIIQVLSMIFLPGSLVSSIFGMGFFSTSAADDGSNAVFAASGRWWLYFAVSIPLTLVVTVIMLYYQWRDSNKAEEDWSRRRSVADLEGQNVRK